MGDGVFYRVVWFFYCVIEVGGNIDYFFLEMMFGKLIEFIVIVDLMFFVCFKV